MNILEIIPQGELRSGGGIQMYRLSKSLSKRGHSLFLIYKEPDSEKKEDFEKIDKSGINLSFMKLGRIKLNIDTVKVIFKLRKFIKENKIEIIHSHKGATDGVAAIATLGLNIPIVANRGVINPLNFFNGLKYRTKLIDRVVAVSQVVKDIMAETGRIKKDKINVVFGSVDIEEFSPQKKSTIREEFCIGKDKIVVGFAGNGGPRKGLPYLAESFKTTAKKYKNAVLFLVGVNEADKERLGFNGEIAERVICAGFRRDVANCMAGMDIFVFSGIAEEGLTGTVREAAAVGLPIITTDVAGNRELIKDGETGVVVSMKDSAAISEAVEKLLENMEAAKKLGANARKFVEENMSNEIRAEKMEKLYLEIIENRKSRR